VKNAWLLAIKFVAIWLVAALVLGALGVAYQPVWLYALIVTLAAYALGDLVILRMYGNAVAVVADVLIAALALWGSMALLNPARAQVPTVSLGEALLFGLAVGVVEIFYHMLVARTLHFRPPGRQPAS